MVFMSQIEVFIKGLQKATGNKLWPVKFWESYPEKDTYTFQDALDKYAEYYSALNPAQKKAMSVIFWAQIEAIGTPVIEDSLKLDGECEVYFLFPKDNLSQSTEEPEYKKDLYLQGDFHGYDTTDGRQRVEELSETGIMLHQDTMPRDAMITYRYIQLEPSLKGKTPTEHHGSEIIENLPVTFFPEEDTSFDFLKRVITEFIQFSWNFAEALQPQPPEEPTRLDVIPPQTKNASDKFWGSDSRLFDDYGTHRPPFFGIGSSERIFRVHANPELSHLLGEEVNWPSLLSEPNLGDPAKRFIYHDTLYSDLEGELKHCEAPVTNQYAGYTHSDLDASPYSQFTRAIHVFKPTSNTIDNIVVVNDGMPYLSMGSMEYFEQMVAEGKLSPNTAFVFVTPLPGLAKTMSADDPKASMPGMGSRTIEYEHGVDQYADFIADKLLPGLEAETFRLPRDPSSRVMVGSSLSGTAGVYIASKRPDLFGSVIAQSPSPSNRKILKDVVAQYTPSRPRANIHLSSGIFEQPSYAANTNLPYATELSERLHIPLHSNAHGHQFLAWTDELEHALPKLLNEAHNKKSLQKLIQDNNVVGASVAVFDNDGVTTFSAGKLARGGEEALTSGGVFEAASLSKPVFAYIVLKMAERGEIDLDEPLCNVSGKEFGSHELRETPQYQKLTARMILSHQTGLPNWMPEEFQAEPQTQFNYSGLAYWFLCDVIQEISGQSLEQLAKRELEPLGIVQSSYFYQPEDSSEEKRRFAVGHNAEGASDKHSHFPRISEADAQGKVYPTNPAASLFITAENYAKFLTACMEDKFIREKMSVSSNDLGDGRDQKALQEGVSSEMLEKLHWGLGMGLQENEDGSKTLFHWGDSETFRNLATIRLETDGSYNGVVCLTNSTHGPSIFRQVTEPVIGSIEVIATWLKLREKLPLSTASFTSSDEVGRHISRTQEMREQLEAMKSEGTKADLASSSQTGYTPKKWAPL